MYRNVSLLSVYLLFTLNTNFDVQGLYFTSYSLAFVCFLCFFFFPYPDIHWFNDILFMFDFLPSDSL